MAVIRTGRNLIFVPSKTLANTSVIPSFFNSLNVLISTIPLSTATPNNAIKPTPAEILNGIPLINKAKTPPMALIGMAVNISAASFMELKVKYSIKKMRSNARGTTTISLEDAFCKFSNVPPYV